jgi:DNA mismatch endonuclease (patch repair protein)
MASVKQKDTTPELVVRSALRKLGFRFRLHRKDLPGKPDVVLSKRKTVIFVHGCFWHRHKGCRRASIPASNAKFWMDKFNRTCKRDKMNQEELASAGWRVLVVWECETKSFTALTEHLSQLLGNA